MNIYSSNCFHYRDDHLFCEEVSVSEIIESVGSPVFLYSKQCFTESYRIFWDAFKEIDHQIFYACKSNYNINVIRIFARLGSGVDVNSEGELFRALHAGVDPSKIIFSGVGKTSEEIRTAIGKEILAIKAESEEEIVLINRIASELQKKARVSIRINPDIQVKTHPYITTGLTENKFGLHPAAAIDIFKNTSSFTSIEFTGIDMHIGSQISDISPFVRAVLKMLDFFYEIKEHYPSISHFDLGGGFGVKYKDENIFEIKDLAYALIPHLKKFGCTIFFEPGRFFTANGGILLTKVLYTKKGERKIFVITDAAMTDIIRPSLYGTYHHIQPVTLFKGRMDMIADIVGPVCETGDFLARDRVITEIRGGEYLALFSAGAYGMVMASNYNARRKPPEVIVDANKYYIVRGRESLDHLIYDEKIIPEL